MLLASSAVGAAPAPRIAILIDDLGHDLAAGERVLALPRAIGVAVLPQTPYARALSLRAAAEDRDLLLHLPLESLDAAELGPGGIAAGASPRVFEQVVAAGMESVPGAKGVNNHMGSLLTQAAGSMRLLMGALRNRGMYFVDSYTTERSVALRVAQESGVPATRRDVFLDPAPTESASPDAVIAEQWQRLLELARKRGVALAIGHPNPTTLAWLERELPSLSARGYELIKVSEVVALETSQGNRWHAAREGYERNTPTMSTARPTLLTTIPGSAPPTPSPSQSAPASASANPKAAQ